MQVLITVTYMEALSDAVGQLLGAGATVAAQRLEAALLEHWPETLAQHPRAGRDYLARNLPTPELERTCVQVAGLYGANAQLRETIEGDYLILYAVRDDLVYLLTVRHHRTVGFGVVGT